MSVKEVLMNLKELKPSENARILRVGGEGALRQHFLDMGVIPGADVTCVKLAPMGDPMELRIHGYELTLRLDDAAQIEIEKITEAEIHKEEQRRRHEAIHPGIGERKKNEPEEKRNLPSEGEKLVFALAGNQNCGKTTLFNQLTGANQHVGNFPGVTVDRKSGEIRGYPNTEVIDLPGIYSLSPYSSEEIISRKFILEEKPTAIINIVDATNIERNLYLTMQLMELGIPMVVALNMMDEMEGNGGHIRINEMEEILQVPVVPISAIRNQGVHELVSHAIHVARYHEVPGRNDFCEKRDHGGAVHRCIHSVMYMIEDHAEAAGIPLRFAANKLIENDPLVQESLKLDANEMEAIEKTIVQMESERGLDRAAAMADMRFLFIQRLCDETVVHPHESKEHLRSSRIDSFLTGKFTAIPAFIAIMALISFMTFNWIGAFFQGLVESGVEYLTGIMDGILTAANVSAPLHSLVIEGIFTGVGSVLSFVPVIVILFFFLSMLEDSGYMARIAFVMDKLLRRIGLSGRSIVPMLIGFGCTVPAVMATRTLPSERDRKMTIMLTPFMSCSAKSPIYVFFIASFFPKKGALVMVSMYLTGIVVGILCALFAKNLFKGEPVPFVMELPNYRMPALKNVLQLMWDKAKDFLQRAFTVIFLGTIIIWFLRTFDFGLNMVSDPEQSMLAYAAGLLVPLFKPLGLGDWRITTALISGFLAKESVVSTLTVLYGSQAGLAAAMSGLTAVTLLVFCLLYTPCIAAIAAVRRESGAKWAAGMVILQCAVAWVCALIVRIIGTLLGF